MLLDQTRGHCCCSRVKSLSSLWHLIEILNNISILSTSLRKLAPSHTTVAYLCQEITFLFKFLKRFLNELQVQAGALGRGAVVFVVPVRQKVDVSATIFCRHLKMWNDSVHL